MDGQLDWGARSQHGDLEEDLDALVDPETQRIVDEADLLEYSEDDDEDEEDDEDDEDEDEIEGSEDDAEEDISPNREAEAGRSSRDASASNETAGRGAGQLAEGAVVPSSPQLAAPAADPLDGLGPLSPIQDMSLPENLDDGAPICERTRTRMPMNHVSIDELDALLGNRDEGLFDEEGEQYQQFLRVLRGEEDLRELLDDDDDEDEDFTLDWDELMGPDPFGEGKPPPPPRRSERQRKYVYKNKNERPGHRERPVQATARLQSKQLKPILPGKPDPGDAVSPGERPQWSSMHTMRLKALVTQHAQLLTTTFAMAIYTPGNTQTAGLAGQMLHALQGVPQWLWNPVLDRATGAVGRATSLQEAVSLIAQLPACFNSALLPRAWVSEGWLPGEDALLCRGVRRFGRQQQVIQQYFLPTRSAVDIHARLQHLTRPAAPHNPVKEANARNTGPLLEHEIKIIGEQLRFMGKQPRRWELIINQHMPYRTVTNVSKMWAAYQASLQGRTAGSVHWTMVTGHAVPPALAPTVAGQPQQLVLPEPPPQLPGQVNALLCVQGPAPGMSAHPPWHAAPMQHHPSAAVQPETTHAAAQHPATQASSAQQWQLPPVFATQAVQSASQALGQQQVQDAPAGPSRLPDTQQQQSSSVGGPGALSGPAGPRSGSAFAPYQRPDAPDSSSNGVQIQPSVSSALLHQDTSQQEHLLPMVPVFSPAEHLQGSPSSEELPRSSAVISRDIPPRARPRKRKQPAPSHSSHASEPLLDTSLDDALLQAANDRVRGGKAGKRGGRTGRGRGRAGRSTQTPCKSAQAADPAQVLQAASARVAAEVRSPTRSKQCPEAAPSSIPSSTQHIADSAAQPLPSSPFWHLPPNESSQQPAVGGSELDAMPPQSAAAQQASGIPGPMQSSAPAPGVAAIRQQHQQAGGHQGGPPAGGCSEAAQPPHAAAQVAVLSSHEPLQHPSGAASAQEEQIAPQRTPHPHCRKSLDFSHPVHEAGFQQLPHHSAANHPSSMPSAGQDNGPCTKNSYAPHSAVVSIQQRGAPEHGPGQTPQAHGNDAELILNGVRTRWTKAEDTAILQAAVKTNGKLTVDACARLMRLPRNATSYPLPRTAKHIKARLEWLLARLLHGKGAQA